MMAEGVDVDEFEFVKVCVEGNYNKAREMLQSGADAGQRIPRLIDFKCGTVLHVTASLGRPDMVSLLLLNGAFVGAFDKKLQTPLHRACEAGNYTTASVLIQHGARVNFSDMSPAPLHLACEAGAPDVVSLLLDNNADVNSLMGDKNASLNDFFGSESDLVDLLPNETLSPLSVAYDNNKIEVARVLTDRGAKCDVPLIHIACLLDKHDLLLQYLIEGGKINAKDKEGRVPLHIAARAGHLSCVKLCLRKKAKINKVDKKGRSALHYAVREDHIDVVTFLLSSFPNLYTSIPDREGKTPLHMACKRNNKTIAQLLLQFDPQILDFDNSVLFMSTDIKIISLLLEDGARVNSKDVVDNSTLMHKACQRGDKELVDLLLLHGAKVNGRESMSGMTPLHQACKEHFTDIALTLIQNGAHVNNQEIWNGYAPLHFACETGDIEIVHALLERHCEFYFGSNREICTQPLEVATKKGHVEIAELIMKQGVAVADDEDSFTSKMQHPLLLACEYRYPKLVNLFLKNGASVDIPDGSNHRADGSNHRGQLFDVVIRSYMRCLENRDQVGGACDVISILIELINAGCRLEHFFTGCELSHLYEVETVFLQKREVSLFLMMTGIDIFENIGDAFLWSILHYSDMETLRVLSSCGYRFSENKLSELCANFEDGDSLLAEAREVILRVPTLQDLCRLNIRRLLRRNLRLEAEMRRKRHLSTRIGDYFRKFAGKKRKTLPLFGINRLVGSLPLPKRVKAYLCFNLFDVT